MLDFIFSIASSILHINLRDPHEIPFALPLVFSAALGFVIAFVILKFIGNENKEMKHERIDADRHVQ